MSYSGVTNWSVGVYIIEPGGRIVKSMGVVEAIDPKKLRSWLQSYVKEGDSSYARANRNRSLSVGVLCWNARSSVLIASLRWSG